MWKIWPVQSLVRIWSLSRKEPCVNVDSVSCIICQRYQLHYSIWIILVMYVNKLLIYIYVCVWLRACVFVFRLSWIFILCMYNSRICFIQFSPFGQIIILHVYIFIPIFIVSLNSTGLTSFVCSWCSKTKVYLTLTYLNGTVIRVTALIVTAWVHRSLPSTSRGQSSWRPFRFYVITG